MFNKIIPVITIISLLFLPACQSYDVVNDSQQEQADKPSTLISKNKTTTISIETVEGISIEEARDLCIDALGEKDEYTGFKYGYRCVSAVEFEGEQYYVMFKTWLVDNSHWSYIGETMVATDGSKIYACAVDADGNYYASTKLWEE